MKFLLSIVLLISLSANSQFGNRNFFGKRPSPSEGFNWNNLVLTLPVEIEAHTGTTTLSNMSISNTNGALNNGHAIYIHGAGSGTIIIENSYIGPTIEEGISIENFSGTLIIRNCLFASNEAGIYAASCTGDIQIEYCQFVNPWGARSCRGQAIQFNTCTGDGSYVRYCVGEGFRSESYTEDWVSMFMSGGSAGNIWYNEENIFRGGGPSTSGGGMLAGDHGGDYITIRNNKLVNPGNYGIAVAGGNHNTLDGNQVWSQFNTWNNAGLIIWGQAGAACSDIIVTNNSINFPYKFGGQNNLFDGGNCGSVDYSTNVYNQSLASMGVPETIITYVTEDQLWHIRDESVQFRNVTGACSSGMPAALPRPTSDAGTNQSIIISSATLNGSGSTSTNGYNYQWEQISGPNNATVASQFTASTSVTGLVTGEYEFRLIVTDNDGAADADWVTITVSIP